LRITFLLLQHCTVAHFRRFISISHTVTAWLLFAKLGNMIDADNRVCERSGRHPDPDPDTNQSINPYSMKSPITSAYFEIRRVGIGMFCLRYVLRST